MIAVDALADFIEDSKVEKTPLEINILKNKSNDKSFSKPWLKKMILICENSCTALEEFLNWD